MLNNLNSLGEAIGEGIYNYFEKENIYIVKSGDTLFLIATKFGISVNDLKETNNLPTSALVVGQELVIPEPKKKEEKPSSDYLTYTVKSGDSLYKIAYLYNTTVSAIVALNNLTINNLAIGQVLKIPHTKKELTKVNPLKLVLLLFIFRAH